MASRTGGAIGYVEYAYAKQNKLTYALLRNKEGQFVTPESRTFQSAAANADWTKVRDFNLLLTNQPGKDSWPITGATFILMHKQQSKPEVAREAINFFDWSYRNGGPMAEQLDYVPMPESVVKMVEQAWQQIKGPDGKPVWTGRSS
jgi:phosphate transport system substrate-binding protein